MKSVMQIRIQTLLLVVAGILIASFIWMPKGIAQEDTSLGLETATNLSPQTSAQSAGSEVPKSLPKKSGPSSDWNSAEAVGPGQVVEAAESAEVAATIESAPNPIAVDVPEDVKRSSLKSSEMNSLKPPQETPKSAKGNAFKPKKQMTSSTKSVDSVPSVQGPTGDVYNFYFQKAPGPQSVSQGADVAAPIKTSGQVENASSEPNRFAVQSEVAASGPAVLKTENRLETAPSTKMKTRPLIDLQDDSDRFRPYRVGVGYAAFTITGFNALMAPEYSFEYDFNEYLGVQANVLFAGPSRNSGATTEGGTRYSAGMIFKPLEVQFFGSSKIGIGLLMGGQSLPAINRNCNPDWYSYNSCRSADAEQADPKFAFYYGASFNLDFSKSIGAHYQFRNSQYTEDRKVSVSSVGMTFRF